MITVGVVTEVVVGTCECGVAEQCVDTWHEVLVAEHDDPGMYPWHLQLVCTFYLQHRSKFTPQHADGQFRMLQFFLDNGVEATVRLARHQVARNGKAKRPFDTEPLAPYAPLPESVFPPAFALSVHYLRDASGGYVGDGYPAYGERMRRLAEATVDAWLAVG